MFFFNCTYLAEISLRSSDFKLFDQLFGKYSKSTEEIDVYKHYSALKNGITGPVNYYRAMLRGYGDKSIHSSQSETKVVPKTLILWGRDDTALISELAQDSARQCKDATVQYLDKCSHWIQVHQPAEVNEIMNKFLQS